MNVPARPDQVPGTPSPGAIAPGQAGIVIARVVIIFGTTGGIFIYNGTPAKGTLVGSIVANGGTDFYGNQYGEGLNFGAWSAVTGEQEQHLGVDLNGNLYLANSSDLTTIYANPSLNLFQVFNSSGEGAGNMQDSIASSAGTDPNGNVFLAEFASYNVVSGSLVVAAALQSGQLAFYTATSESSSYTQQSSIAAGTNGLNIILDPANVIGSQSDVIMNDNFTIAQQQPGHTFPTPEVWHNIVFASGPAWSGSPGQYMLVPLGETGAGAAWINGTLTAGTTFADGTVIGTAPAPASHAQNIPVTTNNALATAGDQSPHLVIETNGNIECFGIRAAGDIIGVNAIYPIN